MEKIDQSKFQRLSDEDRTSEFIARPVVTYWSDAWRRFKENKAALVAFIILVFLIVMVIIGPMLTGYSHEDLVGEINLSPSSKFWFGTDELGRDIFTRIWRGGRISIIIGLAGAIIGTVIGSIYGAASAFFGGRVDTIMMRIVEILISIPYLLLVIILRLALNSNGVGTLILAMTITGWCGLARLVRGQILSLKEQDYIMAARVLGVSNKDIIIKHLIPNTLNVILVSISFDIPGYIFGEAFLSYLGLGVQPPETSWGLMCSQAQQVFQFYPYQLFFPALMIGLTMLSFTLLGDGLRDALDPNLRQ
ncbi:ABC transporter permease subunit [Finegoldia sp. BIOML-A2]|uniref:ABC transporter permease n=1 Tax=Finegoldia TaxID=150022 RepID=UPI0012AFA98E|nr:MULTISPECIES: ABC transporter permease [Finegoldia]MDU1036884.1 ABC transporter permease [Staphylococcus sp.]MBS5359754.1 ABC transporter permease [Finegoldia magna]MBS5970341.1 ABC transporter permease [Finegoldia magna]MDU4209755.1 ABC transporter permease [Finegoldia magna]MDU5507277.1 ABC transporter permease [Finegoldia magna]